MLLKIALHFFGTLSETVWKRKLFKYLENCLKKFVKPQRVELFCGGFYLFGTTVVRGP